MSGYENFRFVVQILFSTLQEKKLCDRLFDTFHTIVVVESSTYSRVHISSDEVFSKILKK